MQQLGRAWSEDVGKWLTGSVIRKDGFLSLALPFSAPGYQGMSSSPLRDPPTIHFCLGASQLPTVSTRNHEPNRTPAPVSCGRCILCANSRKVTIVML